MLRLPLALTLALLAVGFPAGCGESGTGVLLDVIGAGRVDRIDVVTTYDGALEPSSSTAAPSMQPVELPTEVLVILPDAAASVRFDLLASLAGAPAGGGTSDLVNVRPHQVARTSVTLGPCAGPSRCRTGSGPGGGLCTGFEGALAAPFFPLGQGGGTSVLDAVHVCRGAQAIHFTTPASTNPAQLEATVFEQQLVPSSGSLFVRAFFFVPSGSPAQPTDIVSAYQSGPPYGGLSLSLRPGGQVTTNNATGTTAVLTAPSLARVPVDRWTCVEWEVVSSAQAAGAVHVWLDGAAVPEADQTGIPTMPSPPLDTVAIGLNSNSKGPSPAVDLWADELAIDTQRIGCAN